MARDVKRGEVRVDDPFVQYFAVASATDVTIDRFRAVKSAIYGVLERQEEACAGLAVGDIGCGAGTQSRMWAEDGHTVHGIDVNPDLITLARNRARSDGLTIQFAAASGTQIPWRQGSMHVCLVAELLEHIGDWKSCLHEVDRVLRPGGVLYIGTTNALCPVQQEFDLPGYSWYPSFLKRHYERLAMTTRKDLVNHAEYPAVNWFTYYSLRRHLNALGYRCRDRFDLVDLGGRARPVRCVFKSIRRWPWLRFLAHLCTPYTVVVATKARPS